MSRLWPIVRREYLERVRSRAFLIGTIVGPILMTALMILPGAIMARQHGRPLKVAILDMSGALKEPLKAALQAHDPGSEGSFLPEDAGDGPLEETKARLKQRVLGGTLDGYLLLTQGALESSRVEYHGRNVSNLMAIQRLHRIVEDTIVRDRLTRAGLSPDSMKDIMRHVDLKTEQVSEAGDREDQGAAFLLSVILLMLVYMSLAMWGAALMNGVIEEKSNRVVEIIVSSVSPSRLFGGKLLGVGAVGLTQILVWTTFTVLTSVVGSQAAVMGGAQMPRIPLHLMAFFVTFFLLGYFLYGSLYAAIGAAVNSQQEAQSLVFPVMMPLIIGVMFFPAVLGNPDSTLSTVLSLIPFWTPLLMFLRISALTPPVWQIALSIGLTLAAIVGANWAASRIYRIGILMYGKRPTFPEILKWISIQ